MKVQSGKDRQSHRAWFQDLVFYPGPSETNSLNAGEGYQQREAELKALITPGNAGSEHWFRAIEDAYGLPLDVIGIDVRLGGQVGLTMPTIAIDAMGTRFSDGKRSINPVNHTKPEHALPLCRVLLEILGVQWCAANYIGAFHRFRVQCNADGSSEGFPVRPLPPPDSATQVESRE